LVGFIDELQYFQEKKRKIIKLSSILYIKKSKTITAINDKILIGNRAKVSKFSEIYTQFFKISNVFLTTQKHVYTIKRAQSSGDSMLDHF
jgi:hypothetical protein